jgi:hypothetical protein
MLSPQKSGTAVCGWNVAAIIKIRQVNSSKMLFESIEHHVRAFGATIDAAGNQVENKT